MKQKKICVFEVKTKKKCETRKIEENLFFFN